ncbi:MAG: hypothetical protein AAGF12_14850 [Myxococcota bacterium]
MADTDNVDQEVRRALTAGDAEKAVTVLLVAYGHELLGYLCATMPDTQRAREAYALLAEDLWRGLPNFQWRCSARAWAFTLCRHARTRTLLQEQRMLKRNRGLSAVPAVQAAVDDTRTPTPPHLQSELKQRMRELREKLPEDEQALLMLRVDRALSWRDLVFVLDEPHEDSPEGEKRAAARLRQRFQTVKAKLKGLAHAEGLL